VRAPRLLLLVLAAFAPPAARAFEPPLRVCADPNDLPFSNAAGEGFENKIAQMVADEMRRPLQFVWRAQRRGFLREGLNGGECDLVTAVPSGVDMVRTTRPYYRSTYVFVSRPGDPVIASFDDPSLKRRKVGVQLIGDNGMNSPPAHALAARGVVDTVRGFPVYGDYREQNPVGDIVRAVAKGEIDVAAVWGPIGGYFARRQSPPLVVTPLATLGTARIPMVFDIAMGVRKRDEELAQAVQAALDDLKPRIDRMLREYGAPLVGTGLSQ
jgi:mxaJ protein